jgi:N-hydroxyarylamine O-acetyltransferase
MDADQARAYLKRIGSGYAGPPDHMRLRLLQRAHLRTVPFENLSIHLGEPIVLDEDQLFEKIVVRRRGGFCYELNGLFAALWGVSRNLDSSSVVDHAAWGWVLYSVSASAGVR